MSTFKLRKGRFPIEMKAEIRYLILHLISIENRPNFVSEKIVKLLKSYRSMTGTKFQKTSFFRSKKGQSKSGDTATYCKSDERRTSNL